MSVSDRVEMIKASWAEAGVRNAGLERRRFGARSLRCGRCSFGGTCSERLPSESV